MTIEEWLASACADADRRGLPDLKPLLAALADATRAMRAAGWDETGVAAAGPRPVEAAGRPPDGAPQ